MSPGDLSKALSTPTVSEDCFAVEHECRTSDVLTFQAGASHTGTHPLDDQAPFQFCDATDDHHDSPAQWAAGVDLLAEADELDAQTVQLVEHL